MIPKQNISPRGLTLIEVTIALAIAGLLVGLAIPALSNVTRAQLRQKSGQLAGGIRALYGATAISGRSCRLVFDFETNSYWAECSKAAVRLDREGEKSRNGVREETRDEELAASEKERSGLSEQDRARLDLLQKSAFTPMNEVPKTKLGDTVHFADIWVQHQHERYTGGQSFLYFWPNGTSEAAAIHLSQGDDVYSLIVSPLTGRVRVVGNRLDAPGEP